MSTACSVDGCERPAWARGWCGTHYRRWQRHGTTDEPTPRVRKYETYAEYQADRMARNGDVLRARKVEGNRRYRERHADTLKEARRGTWRQKWATPEKRRAERARRAVQAEIKDGRLTRPERCEQCDGAGPIEAAHSNYAEPLLIRWLCRPCHRRWDAADPKTRK